jgi:hypothetical protein
MRNLVLEERRENECGEVQFIVVALVKYSSTSLVFGIFEQDNSY